MVDGSGSRARSKSERQRCQAAIDTEMDNPTCLLGARLLACSEWLWQGDEQFNGKCM